MTKLLILSATYDDPVCRYIESKQFEVCAISLKDFIEHVGVHDWCGDNGARINWQFGHYNLTNAKDTWMLSRLAMVSFAQFALFEESDQEFAFAETMAYLGFAVSQFNQVNAYCNQHGHENLYALPEQWQQVEQSLYDPANRLSVPDYYWGDPRFNHLQSEHLVHSHIYNLTCWRPNEGPSMEPGQMLFCFQRPLGEPVFCSVVGDQVLSTPVDHDVADKTDIDLADWALQISQCFQYFICEVLFFVQREQITLGYVSPALIYSERNPQFSQFMARSLHHLVARTTGIVDEEQLCLK